MTPRAHQVLALLTDNPPISSAAIAAAIGLGRDATGAWLRWLRDAGLAKPTSLGGGALWSTPAKADAYAARKGEREAAQSVRASERRLALAAMRAGRLEDDEACEAWLVPLLRWVPASQCAPMGRVGVASVFELAESA
jgi:hypothetical protein